jgi:hypothetical protein
MARIMASPRQAKNFSCYSSLTPCPAKNCHPKIEQLKNCQLKIHTLEVFAEVISSLSSLSEECGEIGLSRISQLTEMIAAYPKLFF